MKNFNQAIKRLREATGGSLKITFFLEKKDDLGNKFIEKELTGPEYTILGRVKEEKEEYALILPPITLDPKDSQAHDFVYCSNWVSADAMEEFLEWRISNKH
jgi:hypothetical protein